MPRKQSKPSGPAPLTSPRTTCPFGGQELKAVELSTGDWQVRGRGWVSTKLFQTEEQALYYFSFNEGLPPAYKTSSQRIEVTHEQLVPEAKDDDVSEQVAQAVKTGEKMVEALTK